MYTTEEIYKKIFQKVYTVYEVFKDFFGEEYTDLQNLPDIDKVEMYLTSLYKCSDGEWDVDEQKVASLQQFFCSCRPFIMVYWPEVTVTNEYDKSVNIQELYAKITLEITGRIPYESPGFTLNRAKYSTTHLRADYMHSHIPGIPFGDFSRFLEPCLGRGPIRETIMTLRNESNEVTWMLFCQELAMYVIVESISGVPYRRLERINSSENEIITDFKTLVEMSKLHKVFGSRSRFFQNYSILHEIITPFIKFYLEKGTLKLSYTNHSFVLGLSDYEFLIDISNAFIEYYNSKEGVSQSQIDALYNSKIVKDAVIRSGRFYECASSASHSFGREHIGKHVCFFKGKDIKISVFTSNATTESVTILAADIAAFILKCILRTINYRFKYEHNRRNEEQGVTTPCEKAIYL